MHLIPEGTTGTECTTQITAQYRTRWALVYSEVDVSWRALDRHTYQYPSLGGLKTFDLSYLILSDPQSQCSQTCMDIRKGCRFVKIQIVGLQAQGF